MSELGLTTNEEINAILQSQTTGYIIVAAFTLVAYDALLSFPKEARCMWNRRFGAVTILYPLIRYGTIVDILLQVLDGFYIPRVATSCRILGTTGFIVDIACRLAYTAFNCLRIWGITNHQWLSTGIVFLLSVFDPAINIYSYSDPLLIEAVSSGPLAGCWGHPKFQQYIYFTIVGVIDRAISVASDAAVLFFTLFATWSLIRAGSEVHTSTTLASTLFVNGSMHFGILLLLNIVAAILDALSIATTTSASSRDLSYYVYIQQILNSILLSHFILDLRSIYLTDSNISQSSHRNTSLQFAANIQGNLGASLDASWFIGEERDIEEVERIQYSDNPLATGLFDAGENVEIEEGKENIQDITGTDISSTPHNPDNISLPSEQ